MSNCLRQAIHFIYPTVDIHKTVKSLYEESMSMTSLATASLGCTVPLALSQHGQAPVVDPKVVKKTDGESQLEHLT